MKSGQLAWFQAPTWGWQHRLHTRVVDVRYRRTLCGRVVRTEQMSFTLGIPAVMCQTCASRVRSTGVSRLRV